MSSSAGRRQSSPVRAGPLLLLLGLLATTACWEDPVREELVLDFREDGAVEVTATVHVRRTEGTYHYDPPVRERAEEARRRLEATGFGWPERLSALGPERLRSVEERVGGELRERRFRALYRDPAVLESLLPAGLIRLELASTGDGRTELALVIEPGTRANRRQQELLAEREEELAGLYLDYLEASVAVVRLMDERPSRRERIVFHVLGSDEEPFERSPPPEERELDEVEEAAVRPVKRASQEIFDAFLDVPEGERHQLNGLSRLVHDPFAFDLLIRLPVAPEEVVGFAVDDAARRLRAPRPSLTDALTELSRRWLEPDWFVLLWTREWKETAHGAELEQKLDLGLLAEAPRHADPPASTAELREALRQAMRPPEELRLRWRSSPPPPENPKGERLAWSEEAAQR